MSSNEWKLASSIPSLDAHRDELDVVDMNVISNHEYKRNQLVVGGWEAEEFVWESVRYGDRGKAAAISRRGIRVIWKSEWRNRFVRAGSSTRVLASRQR